MVKKQFHFKEGIIGTNYLVNKLNKLNKFDYYF